MIFLLSTRVFTIFCEKQYDTSSEMIKKVKFLYALVFFCVPVGLAPIKDRRVPIPSWIRRR